MSSMPSQKLCFLLIVGIIAFLVIFSLFNGSRDRKASNKPFTDSNTAVVSASKLNIHDSIVHNGTRGDNFFDIKNIEKFGQVVDVTKNPAKFEAYKASAKEISAIVEGGSDHEAADIVTGYFWGKTNGIIMELGAIDGTYMSQSKPLEEKVGWHRILVEGAPEYRVGLFNNAKNAFAFNCAICETAREVHYVSSGSVGGIVEFMTPDFINQFHKSIAATEPSKWSTLTGVQKVACFPLHKVLAATRVQHINVFILDVEGGEYSVMNSIHWDAVRFDIIIVETDKMFRPAGYEEKVTTYLAEKGYKKIHDKGRNTWYQHPSFVPSVMPK